MAASKIQTTQHTMYHKPTLDLGTALAVFCILFALGIANVLGGCTTAKQPSTSYQHGTNLTTARR